MVVLAVIIVVAVIAAVALAAAGVTVRRALARRHAAAASAADDDLEKADLPTRKFEIRHGRAVSVHSTAPRALKTLVPRLPTPKFFSSRPSSTASLPCTIDLEAEIQAFRRDYARAKELEEANPGTTQDVNGLIPVTRLESPRPAFKPKVLSAINESDDPADVLKESSWETYNGHRQTNHPLASPLAPISPLLEKVVEGHDIETALANIPLPAPARTRSSEALFAASQSLDTAATRSAEVTPQPEYTSTNAAASRPTGLRLNTLHLGGTAVASSPQKAAAAAATEDTTSPTYAPSIQSAIYKSPIHDLVPAAPQPRKPSKLDLRGSFSKLDYGFPTPPASASAVASPTSPTVITPSSAGATLGFSTRNSMHLDAGRTIGGSDVECATPKPHDSPAASRASSRSAQRSKRSRSRSSSHRVQKRPPPLSITEPMPRVPGAESPVQTPKRAPDSSFLESPTASDTESLRRKSTYSIASSTYSGFSPTFATTPVFRVPLYAGKSISGPKLKIIASKKGAAALPADGDLERRGSDGDVVYKPTRIVREAQQPSVLRTYSQSAADMPPPAWPPGGLQTMLRQAHTQAQRSVPAATKSTAASASAAKPPAAAPHLVRPILKNRRTVSHDGESPTSPKKLSPGARPTATRSTSAQYLSPTARSDGKQLPPLPRQVTTIPPGAARVPIASLRTELPSDANADAAAAAAAVVAATAERRGSAAPVRPAAVRKRSGLERIAGAVLKAAETTVVVTHYEIDPLATSRSSSGESSDDSENDAQLFGKPPHVRTTPKASREATRPGSPVSAASTPDPKRRPEGRGLAARRWADTGSAVSPLSSDFPLGVTV